MKIFAVTCNDGFMIEEIMKGFENLMIGHKLVRRRRSVGWSARYTSSKARKLFNYVPIRTLVMIVIIIDRVHDMVVCMRLFDLTYEFMRFL